MQQKLKQKLIRMEQFMNGIQLLKDGKSKILFLLIFIFLLLRFPKVSEEFLVEHHMNSGLESSSGVRYDVQQQTYVHERDGMTYKLDKDTQQWIPLQSYTDETNHIKYTFSKKHNTWIPDVSTYSTNDQEGKQQSYVWLKDQLNWALLSSVDNLYRSYYRNYDIDGIIKQIVGITKELNQLKMIMKCQ